MFYSITCVISAEFYRTPENYSVTTSLSPNSHHDIILRSPSTVTGADEFDRLKLHPFQQFIVLVVCTNPVPVNTIGFQ
ncbi:MAG: hypothetical protein JGK17_25690 [Microcoleus sp. PH2017_10_PVI_O_A]|uniref:hypothetical protein n=1 Tax=unclassified Microcoleus TaxID=2642155 RepID=UPI001D9BC438|nr:MULTISPECIES: hypothetical protein [unclassified Microcoleus]MCC3408905.1 hypothetical protein [Microcoleus sp. PH2017_10_PVI_O_A]MCC3463040.1 hypothetical protein [Microcoleus sp. PH2017_11_PCY_U_A]MCC3481425.1 hypothetical protein [Microcoleus sp. PH2017_12_PCY_D_A]